MHVVARLASLVLVLLLLLPGDALAQRARGRDRVAAGIPMHFENRDVTEVVDAVARATGQRFVYGDEVRGRVTITVPERVSEEEALELLFAALYMRGFTPLRLDEDTIRIVPVLEIAGGAPFSAEADAPRGERPITTLIELERADAGQVVATLSQYVARSGVAVAYPPTNSVVLAGTEGQVARLIRIARSLDRAAAESLLVRAIRYRSAEFVADIVDTIFNRTPVPDDRVSIWTDERTNRVIVQGHPAKLAEVRAFVAGIDVPPEEEGLVRVVRVRNRDAEELAQLLLDLAEARRGAPATPTPVPGQAEVPDLGDELVGRQYHVEVDVPTQSLLITADAETFAVLSGVIAELDKLAPRVVVEVLLFEVSRPMGYKIGTNYFLPLTEPSSRNDFVVFTQSAGGPASGPSGDSVVFGRYAREPIFITLTGPDGTPISVPISREDVSFQAGERLAETNILLSPKIIGVSGEEHEVFAGSNIPVPISAGAPTAPADGTEVFVDPLAISQNIERVDVGTRLRIKPTIGQEGNVRVELAIEVAEVIASAVGDVNEVGPTYAKRDLEATVELRPGQKAVLGSTTGAVETERRVGVPFLKDIPGLGWLFGTTQRRHDETDLIAVVEARILRDADEMAAESIRHRLAFERSVSRTADLHGVGNEPFAVLLETARSEVDARVIAEAFSADGFETRITTWNAWGQDVWDVYLTDLESFEEAGRLARGLADAGWSPEITVLSPVNELAGD